MRGSLGASFHVDELIEQVLPEQARQLLHVQVSDVTTVPTRRLFESHPASHESAAADWRREAEHFASGLKVLVLHGADDPSVPPDDSQMMAAIPAKPAATARASGSRLDLLVTISMVCLFRSREEAPSLGACREE